MSRNSPVQLVRLKGAGHVSPSNEGEGRDRKSEIPSDSTFNRFQSSQNFRNKFSRSRQRTLRTRCGNTPVSCQCTINAEIERACMNYRSEIDGLRALAVVPVILFHAGFTAFSGGFVGVDVFFVISGYLITSIILQEMNARTFTLAGFYERRARRILPALVFVITACIPFAWAWMQPDDFKEFFQSIVSVSLFASNIFFWRQSGYFDGDAELRPLLHTWTLAVEEQYYLFFPLLLLLLWRLGKRSIVPTIATLALLSFALAEWGSHNKPTPTFFLLPTRGWELLIGVCVALYLSERPDQPGHFRNRSISELSGFIGLCLIGYSILAFDKATPFPGVHALAPTIGTALIILCATPETTLGRFLGTNWLVSVGLISYSAYLWHQPLFAFARLRSFGEPGTVMFMCLAGLSMALAWLTWRYIESPFRDRTRTNQKAIFRLAALATMALICVGFLGQIDGGFKHRWRLPENVARSLDDSALRRECVDRPQVVKAGDSFCRIGSRVVSRLSWYWETHMLLRFSEPLTSGQRLQTSRAQLGQRTDARRYSAFTWFPMTPGAMP